MMTRSSVHHFGMKVGSTVMDEAVEEIVQQFDLEVADEPGLNQIAIHECRATAEIDSDNRERLIHRQDEVAGAIDAFAISERFGEQLAHDDAAVFYCVVLVDVEVTGGVQGEVKATM